VESGGGNNPLNADDRDMDTQPDMDMAPVDVSANAPRMAPARLPAAARQETATSWRQARDLCFANDQWSSPVSQAEITPAFGEEPATDSMAALLGLGVVLGSYWGAPTREEEQRKKDAANFKNQES
jgi:hypothetical protein